jgi:hypothetical protein
MLKRLLLIKDTLIQMVVHPNWSACRGDGIAKTQRVKDLVPNDVWWDKIEYMLSFTNTESHVSICFMKCGSIS